MSGMDMYAHHESPAGLAMMIGTGYGEGGEGGGSGGGDRDYRWRILEMGKAMHGLIFSSTTLFLVCTTKWV
jgi:hypothetical protein